MSRLSELNALLLTAMQTNDNDLVDSIKASIKAELAQAATQTPTPAPQAATQTPTPAPQAATQTPAPTTAALVPITTRDFLAKEMNESLANMVINDEGHLSVDSFGCALPVLGVGFQLRNHQFWGATGRIIDAALSGAAGYYLGGK